MTQTPPWWQTTTIYQVYPRSFADSNGDGIGDLPGIIDHLDHLVDLGVGTLWVSPFFDSPQRDFGYDIRDYRSVAPEYGTVEDAQRLIDEAHRRDLRVVFDLVLNHTSDEHPWFVESRSSRDNPRSDWYVWADGGTARGGRRTPPNNWRSHLVVSRAWQWSDEREQWFLASFLPCQPDLNWWNPDVKAEMFDMVRSWLERGVDGFRLDMFGAIMHDPTLRNNSRRPRIEAGLPNLQTPNRTSNTDDNFVLAAELREVTDEFDGDRVLLGEVFGTPDVLRRYVSDRGRNGLHLVFLFEFLSARYSARRYHKLIERFEREFPAPLLPSYVVENHDRSRSLSRLGGNLDKARVVATLLCTLRGLPVLYQGQEIGMENRYIPLADAQDPIAPLIGRWLPEWLSRRLPERFNRDEVRTPMQWTSGQGAGFCPSDVEPWLPIHDNHTTRNVEVESTDETSLLRWYQDLLALRAGRPALFAGDLTLAPQDDDVLSYTRRHDRAERADDGADVVQVLANLGSRTATATVDPTATDPTATDAAILLASDPSVSLNGSIVRLPPNTAAIISIA